MNENECRHGRSGYCPYCKDTEHGYGEETEQAA